MSEKDQFVENSQAMEQLEEEIPKDQYLIFSIDEESFGIDINYVIEIIGMELITVVPDLPEYVKGVINLRGKVIPVMDVRLKFNMVPKEYNSRTCIIVVLIKNIYMGLIIDEVVEVMSIEEKNIMAPPKGGKEKENISSHYIWGIVKTEEYVRLLIDGEKLLETQK